jgi:hypothetical protein
MKHKLLFHVSIKSSNAWQAYIWVEDGKGGADRLLKISNKKTR